MFNSARIKLTAWYLLIIMLVSVFFSIGIYHVLTSELDRVERAQRIRIQRGLTNVFLIPPSDDLQRPFFLDPELVQETKNRLITSLAIINIGILGTSAAAGYFLAGRTLKPIKDMVDEQNSFVTSASHELRTPITSLRSEIEVNLRDKKLTLAQAKQLLNSNLEEVNNLQVLSDDLIKLTKYQKGENGLTVSNLSLSEVLSESVRKVTNLAKNKNITITDKTSDLNIEGNKQSLTELFVILLDNAIKYSPENTQITVTSESKDNHILVSVSDQGIGINDEDIPHLFDRFYRTDKSRTKSDVPGYGLGLSIAKEITDRHYGTINVRSKLGEGSTFTVQIPIKHVHKII